MEDTPTTHHMITDVIYNVVTFIASRAVGREDRWDLVLRKRRTEKEEAHRSHNRHKRDCVEERARVRTLPPLLPFCGRHSSFSATLVR